MNFAFLFIAIITMCGLAFWKKRAWPIFAILLLFCFILMGYNIQNPDYDNYVYRFEFAAYPDTNNILSLLDVSDSSFQALCKDFGVQTYEQYRLMLTGLILAFWGRFVYKECVYCNIFLIIYIICYIIIDIVQIRNFEAFVILLPFIPLLSKGTLKSTIIYLGGVLISATFHFSMIFFFIFALMNISSRKIRIIVIGLLLITLAPLSNIISDSAAVGRVDAYDRSSFLGALFGISFVVLNYFMIKRVSRILLSQPIKKISNIAEFNPHFMKELNFMLLMIIPFFFINATISRLFRYISIINVIFMLNAIYLVVSCKMRIRLSAILILYITYFAIKFVYADHETCMMVLTNNAFFKD